MGDYQYQDECPACERSFRFIRAGGPCATCQRCCDCCSCQAVDFHTMQEEVRSLYPCDLISLEGDCFAQPFEDSVNSTPNMDLFDKNMVKIAIWPYTMDDDEIVFDPETGHLTEKAAQKVKHYLELNMAMIPPDEERPSR